MQTITESFDYFDSIQFLEEIKLREDIAHMNEEFKEWLGVNGCYLQEVQAQQQQIPWQQAMISSIQNIVGQSVKYAYQVMPGDSQVLEKGRDILLDQKRFPPKPNEAIQKATNYSVAIQRLSAPLATGLKGLDLSKVDDDPKQNLALKKRLIPTYDGKSDFIQFAKLYFYGGEGARQNLNPQQVGQLIKLAFQFCSSYQSRIQGLQADVKGIVDFIQQNPNTGQIEQQTKSDLARIQAMQSKNAAANQGMDSTNPAVNAGVQVARPVNADTDFSIFMETYFGKDWESLSEAPIAQVPQQGPVAGNKPVSPVTNPQATKPAAPAAITAQQQQKQQAPNGAPVDPAALARKKQEIAAGIVRDVLTAKLAAMGMVYRDLMLVMRTHIAAYKGAALANAGQQPQQQQAPPQAQPQQQIQQ